MEEVLVFARWGKSAWDGGKLMLYNAGLEPIESMLVKKVGSLSLGCSPFLFFYTSLFKTICYICDFFSLSISVFCCV